MIKSILELIGCISMTILFFFTVINVGGLFLSFEYGSPLCYSYRNKAQTNLEYYFIPITSYACKKDSGLFQPYITSTIEWFGEIHK